MNQTRCQCGRLAVAYLHPTRGELAKQGPSLPYPVCVHHVCLNRDRVATLDEAVAGFTVAHIDTPGHRELTARLDKIRDTK